MWLEVSLDESDCSSRSDAGVAASDLKRVENRALGATTNSVQITLSPSTSPTAGQPDVTVLNLTGTNFPAGTITASNVTVSLKPSVAGAGPAMTATTTGITTLTRSSRRITFKISGNPVTAPTAYVCSVSGTTSDGTAFASVNTAALTVNPPASIVSIAPNQASPGQTMTVTIKTAYTDFVQGATQASFGADISVASAAAGAYGVVTVTSPTTATVSIAVAASAIPGPRLVTVRTGVQQASSTAFSINVQGANQAPVVNAGAGMS